MHALQQRTTSLNYRFKFIVTVFFFIPGFLLPAQDYLPTLRDDAVWTIGRGQGMGSYRYFEVRLLCESVEIDGLLYRPITIGALEDDCSPEIGYVREDLQEKKVYYLSSLEDSPYSTEEVLIADYSLSVGDSIRVPDWGATLYVDAIYQETWFDGQEYKFFQLSNPHFSYYEGIGSQLYGVVPECHVYCFLFDYELDDGDCDTPVSVADPGQNTNISCFPNPVASLLTIRQEEGEPFRDTKIVLSDLMGKEYLSQKLEGTEIQLGFGQLPAGVFVLCFYENGQLVETKKISHF